MEKYDINTETWSFGPNMKRKRSGAGVCVCDGKIYVAGRSLKVFSIKMFKSIYDLMKRQVRPVIFIP